MNDMNTISMLTGGLAGVLLTISVYPYVLQRRAKRLLDRCSAQSNTLGDPVSNYLALTMYQTVQAYSRWKEGRAEESQAEIANILAGYASFLTMKRTVSQSEQGALDAIRCACATSDILRQAFDAQVSGVTGKSTEVLLKELEIELANHTPEGIRRPVDGSPKPSA